LLRLDMKDLLKQSLLGSRVLRLAARMRGAGAAVLMYHSVKDDPSTSDCLGGIAHSVAAFREQMELLSQNFRPVRLDQVAGFVKGQTDLPSRAVAVTFDDGYADNYDLAGPMLKHLGIPAAFFVAVDCIAKGEAPWPARLRFTFRTTCVPGWQDANGASMSLKTDDERERAFRHACDLCGKLSGEAQREFIATVASQLQVEHAQPSGAEMMTAGELRQLRDQGHIIGSHSMTHPNLAHLGLVDLRYELEESKRALEAMLGEPVKHFAYPCPSSLPHWNETTAAACARAGYEISLTTAKGLAKPGDKLQLLKRVRPGKTVEELRWNLECAFAGRAV